MEKANQKTTATLELFRIRPRTGIIDTRAAKSDLTHPENRTGSHNRQGCNSRENVHIGEDVRRTTAAASPVLLNRSSELTSEVHRNCTRLARAQIRATAARFSLPA